MNRESSIGDTTAFLSSDEETIDIKNNILKPSNQNIQSISKKVTHAPYTKNDIPESLNQTSYSNSRNGMKVRQGSQKNLYSIDESDQSSFKSTTSTLWSKNSQYALKENQNPNAQSKGSSSTQKKVLKKSKVHKNIKTLVVGATGAGKSSLINLFYVWSQKWGPSDLQAGNKRVQIKTEHLDGDGEAENNVGNQGESQTKKAKHYSFALENSKNMVRYTLDFLDTPGIGDTAGIDEDEKHFDLILSTIQKTSQLNAILLVMNGADARINARVRYIMTKLQGIIPDSLRENLIILLTNVDLVPNLDINKVLDFQVEPERIFYYNNQIFKLSLSQFLDHNVVRKLDRSFKDSITTLSAMLDKISSCSVKPTQDFIEIKECRDKLKKTLVDCNDTATRIYQKKQDLQGFAADLASGKLKISDLQKQLNKVDTNEEFESQPTPYHNTTCLTCKNCCHERCSLNETKNQGDSYFMSCWAFSGSGENCGRCSHSYKSHVHLREKYVKRTVQVPRVDPNIQTAIQQAQSASAARQQASNAVDAEIKRLDQEQHQNHETIKKIIKKIQKVCSRFDYIKEVDACIGVLDEQIDAATSDFSASLSHADGIRLDSLKNTRAKMEKLKDDLLKHLNKSSWN